MKQLFILGNWKSNKTLEEATQWKEQFDTLYTALPTSSTLILCPAFHHLQVFTGSLPYALGVQDLSPFDSGAYTGELSAAMVEGRVTYALLGHSERRKYFGETNELIAEKVKQALAHSIRPIVCVSDVSQAEALKRLVPDFSASGLILYEPLFAIGSGKSDSPENANQTAKTITDVLSVPILYGGSVVPENVHGFVSQEYLSGVGVGGASLDAAKFHALIQAV